MKPPKSITLKGVQAKAAVGSVQGLNVQPFPTDADLSGLTVTSSDDTIVKVHRIPTSPNVPSDSFWVQGIRSGKVTLQAKAGTATKDVPIEIVQSAKDTVTAMTAKVMKKIDFGSPIQFATVTSTPKVDYARTVTWESSDPSVMDVDKHTGALFPVSVGTAKITATHTRSGVVSSAANVEVTNMQNLAAPRYSKAVAGKATTIKANIPTPHTNLSKSEQYQIAVDAIPEGSDYGNLTFISSDDTLATVDTNGLVTPLKQTNSVYFNVNSDVAGDAVTPVFWVGDKVTNLAVADIALEVGAQKRTEFAVTPTDAYPMNHITLKGFDDTIVDVKPSFNVGKFAITAKGLKAGTTKGTVALQAYGTDYYVSSEFTITVTDTPPPPQEYDDTVGKQASGLQAAGNLSRCLVVKSGGLADDLSYFATTPDTAHKLPQATTGEPVAWDSVSFSADTLWVKGNSWTKAGASVDNKVTVVFKEFDVSDLTTPTRTAEVVADFAQKGSTMTREVRVDNFSSVAPDAGAIVADVTINGPNADKKKFLMLEVLSGDTTALPDFDLTVNALNQEATVGKALRFTSKEQNSLANIPATIISSDPSVIEVKSNTGTALKAGTAVITSKMTGYKPQTLVMTVTAP